jgi:hypothetical protein
MEHRWNGTGRRNPKYSGRNLSQSHFVHQKSHMDCPGVRCERPATNRLSHARPSFFLNLVSSLLVKRFCYKLNAAFASANLDLISSVHIASFVIMYGYSIWPLTLKDEIRLMVFQKSLRRTVLELSDRK